MGLANWFFSLSPKEKISVIIALLEADHFREFKGFKKGCLKWFSFFLLLLLTALQC